MNPQHPAAPKSKVPVTIITGFLGAGKTTLLRHVLQNAGGRRLALIINEFGDVGVDGEILRSCGLTACRDEDIIELSNGCLCCTVADDFVPAIEKLLARTPPPDHIVIETSGLALPKPLLKAFQWPAIRNRLTVDGVVAVVDGPAVACGQFASDPARVAAQREADPSLDHDNPLIEVFGDQVQAADLVVLNKADLMDEAALTAARATVAKFLPRAVNIVTAREGKISANVALGLFAAAEDDLSARPSCHDLEPEHDHDDFRSTVVAIEPVESPAQLTSRAAAAAALPGVLRIKGYAAVTGKPMRLLVQGVGQRFDVRYERPWGPDEPRRGQLVVIGETGFDAARVATLLRG